MKVNVYRNRQIVLETNDVGTQYENLAETLFFEFPAYVEKNGELIETSTLNKYIVFDVKDAENTDLIINDKYTIPYAITQLGKVVAFIQLKEHTDNDDMTDKLIWISDGFPLTFDKSIETNIEITQEKVDAFNTLYTELNLRILEVTQLKSWIEQFQQDVEDGKYTPKKGIDYFTPQEIAEIENEVLQNILSSEAFTQLRTDVDDIREELDGTHILVSKKKGENE